MAIYRIPLTQACTAEVLGRVAYRLVVRDWRNAKDYPSSEGISAWLRERTSTLPAFGFGGLKLWMWRFADAVDGGLTVASYLSLAIAESRAGRALTVRRALSPDYKANRNPTPRVTNRGGQTRGVWDDPLNNATLPDDLLRRHDDAD